MPYLVVVANAGQERTARRDVRDLGFVTYQPIFREQQVHRGRKRWADKLLLGRYFFAKHDSAVTSFLDILTLRRVFGLLMQGDGSLKPSLASDAEIQRFRDSEDSRGYVIGAIGDHFILGQRVRAIMGAFVGLEGTFIQTGRGGCDVATFDVFGRPTKIEFKPGALAAA